MTVGAGESGEIGVTPPTPSPPHAATRRRSSTDRCRTPTLMLVLVANRDRRGEYSPLARIAAYSQTRAGVTRPRVTWPVPLGGSNARASRGAPQSPHRLAARGRAGCQRRHRLDGESDRRCRRRGADARQRARGGNPPAPRRGGGGGGGGGRLRGAAVRHP